MSSLFTKDSVFQKAEEFLLKEADHCNIDLAVYLFMPNHFHLITVGKEQNSDALDFMKRFKQDTGFWFSKCNIGQKWQKDFFDHIIRDVEDLKNQVYYILNNPVRKGLVTNWKDYSYKGSTMFNLDEFD